MPKTHYFKCNTNHLEFKRDLDRGWGLIFVMVGLRLYRTREPNTFVMDDGGVVIGEDYEVGI